MRYQCIVSYDGSTYCGWQSQKGQPSIQDEITKAIEKICNHEVKIVAAGRTDAKVHALGQVFHFDTEKTIKNFKKAINSQLPENIHLMSIQAVDPQFHSRFSAKWKHYDYLIQQGEYNPLLAHYAAQVPVLLDVDAMQEAAKVFLGTHDFTSFNATKQTEIADQTRTIYDIVFHQKNNVLKISYYGNGFLRYMIRMLSETLIQVGLGKISTEDIIVMLQQCSKTACHYNGNPAGLYLVEVGYTEYEKS